MELPTKLLKCICYISKRKAICLATAALLFSACGNFNPEDRNSPPDGPDSIKTVQTAGSIPPSSKQKYQTPSGNGSVRRIPHCGSS